MVVVVSAADDGNYFLLTNKKTKMMAKWFVAITPELENFSESLLGSLSSYTTAAD